MTTPQSAMAVLDREFLEIRAKILEIAASLDRLQRGAGDLGEDQRYRLLQQGIETLKQVEIGRAERLQQLFSRPYDPNWRSDFGI